MPRILMILSAATQLPLTDGSCRTTGFWPEEVIEPLKEFAAAGAHITLATPGGRPAVPDPAGFTPEGAALPPDRCDTLRREVAALQGLLAQPVPLHAIKGPVQDAVFIPGGYAPMADLWSDPHCGRVLEETQRAGRPIAAVCHGPAALLSCRTPAGDWPFTGYRMTSFTDQEEKDVGLLDTLPWTAQQALTARGADFRPGPGPWREHLVQDRGLLTGQNPASARPLAARLLAVLTGTQGRANAAPTI
ncbi:type 1 glutamine amidotransferase domain-containing protein [Streptomyces orinoci]|uniref:Type 1 glutamine amidotransferase domain-containing protein n=1 Tax=Streptomyces orinoci TaxID=67339 RepID=A0ABV3K745_STRON|nr:type 1 glutamine amidotransferase domain-containing protein [Streptomyces orinoci]